MEENIEQIEAPSCTFEEKSKEIDLIQSLINRMANSQLQTKIFCISVIALIIIITFLFAKSNEVGSTTHLICSLFAKSNECTIFVYLFKLIILTIILIVVIESFRALDRNFLRTEKIYRVWYDYVREIRDTNRENLYLLNPIKMQEILVMHNRLNINSLKESTKQSWALAFYRNMYWVVFVIVCVNYPDF
jgi:hypothetical protein